MAARKTAYYLNDRLEELHSYSINIEDREIYLHGHLDEEDAGVDHIMLLNANKNIRFLESLSDEPIVIHHYNIGGNADCGFALYDLIKNSSCKMVVVCHGLCASAGTFITQAADIRLCMPNCYFLLHEGYNNFDGTYREYKSNVEVNVMITKKMMDIYAGRIKEAPDFQHKTITAIKKYVEQKFDKKMDWYLTPEETYRHGLVDDVVGVTKYKSLKQAIEASIYVQGS
jgi:ATP-dependent Clp protease protease subunit